jgi:hypothetical protein
MKKSLILVIIVALVGLVVYNKVFIPKHTFSVVSAKKPQIKLEDTYNITYLDALSKKIYNLALYKQALNDYEIAKANYYFSSKVIMVTKK